MMNSGTTAPPNNETMEPSSATTPEGGQKGQANTTLASILTKLDRLLKVIQKLQDEDTLTEVMGGGPRAQMARKLCDLWATRVTTTVSPEDDKDYDAAIESFCRQMSTTEAPPESLNDTSFSTEESATVDDMKQNGNRILKGRRSLDEDHGFVKVGPSGDLEPLSEESEGSVHDGPTDTQCGHV